MQPTTPKRCLGVHTHKGHGMRGPHVCHVRLGCRPPCPVVVLSSDEKVLRGATGRFGLYPYKIDVDANNFKAAVMTITEKAK